MKVAISVHFVELAGAGAFDDYDAVLKVHTKRSPHRQDGDAWRVALLDGVMPSPDGIQRIVELLRGDEFVGLVVPNGSLHGAETWGSNQVLVEALASRIPFAFDPSQLRYPAGSMYWARPWVLRRLADLELGRERFESEAGHVDGSTAHALERFVGVAARTSGLDIVEADDVAARLHRARRRPRRRPKVLAFYLPQFHKNYRRTTRGGAPASPTGSTSTGRGLCTRGIASLSSRGSSDATTSRIRT